MPRSKSAAVWERCIATAQASLVPRKRSMRGNSNELPRRSMARWWKVLLRGAFSKYLIITNSLSGAFLDGLADCAEQHLEGVRPHNWGRTARMAIIGLTLGPVDHHWYRQLDRRLPGRGVRAVTAKVLVDMTILGPFEIVVFYLGELVLQMKRTPELLPVMHM